ncbi:MAG: O-antigen ligase family protein [Rhizobacter sp.]
MGLRLSPIWFFLVTLMIAPQLWLEPFVGMRTDAVLYIFWTLLLVMRGRLGLVFKFSTQDWLFIAMLVWIELGAAVTGFTDASKYWFNWYLQFFLVYRLTAASVDTAEEFIHACWALLVIGLIMSLEGYMHAVNPNGMGWAGQSFAWIDDSAKSIGLVSRTRWVGVFDGPGVFCVIYTIALPFALQNVGPPNSKLKSALAGVGLVFPLVMGIYYTGSRGGMLTAIAILAMYILSKFKLSLMKLIMFGVIGMGGLMLGPAYLTASKDSHGSAQGRVDMWDKGLEMVQTHPVFGIGKGNYVAYTKKLIAHNSAIEVMGETGFPGFFMWLGISFIGIRNLMLRSRQTDNPTERRYLLGLMFAILGYFVSSLFVTLEYQTPYYMLGLTAAVGRRTEGGGKLGEGGAKKIVFIIVGYFIFFKLYVMTYYG